MPTVSVTPCVITGAPSYFGTTQTFDYNDKEQMTSRKYDFGFPGYGPYTQTVAPGEINSSYTLRGGVLEERDVFLGGTGNLYDGTPTMMIRFEHQTNASGQVTHIGGPDTLYGFSYDDKKRLIQVDYFAKLRPYSPSYSYEKTYYKTMLKMTYDNNDNVVKMQQIEVERAGSYNVNIPSESYFTYDEKLRNDMTITYDDKPSPYSSVLKYWKFVQNDWGLATNSSWTAILAALSKNNALHVTFATRESGPSSYSFSNTYNYNTQGFPVDGFIYNCK
ncbi:MAG: hypothetical protein ABW036_11630 [Flavitalea sp.]